MNKLISVLFMLAFAATSVFADGGIVYLDGGIVYLDGGIVYKLVVALGGGIVY